MNEDGVQEYEENFEEALKAVNFAVAPTTVPKSVQDILNDANCINLTSKVRLTQKYTYDSSQVFNSLINYESWCDLTK